MNIMGHYGGKNIVTNKEIRKAIGKQLNYVSRDLKYIDSLLLKYKSLETIFTSHELKHLQVVNYVSLV